MKNLNNKYFHILKLWTANLKHFSRKRNCYDDIVDMAKKVNVCIKNKTEKEILEEVLFWLEKNASNNMIDFIKTCRIYFRKLTK